MTLREQGNGRLRAGDARGACECYERALRDEYEAERHLVLSNLCAARLACGEAVRALEAAVACAEAAPAAFVAKARVREALARDALGEANRARELLGEALAACTSEADRAAVRRVRLAGESARDAAARLELAAAQAALKAAAGERARAAQAVAAARGEVHAARAAAVSEESLAGAAPGRAAPRASPPSPTPALPPAPAPAPAARAAAPGALPGAALSLRRVMIFARVDSEDGQLRVSWEQVGESAAVPAGDWIGLYACDELDVDEYWSVEADLSPGTFSMRAPTKAGAYEFRYVAEGGARCAGRSQTVWVVAGEGGRCSASVGPTPAKVPFLLLKEPNLLAYWLYLPLRSSGGGALDISGTVLPALLMTADPDVRVATLTVERRDKRRLVVIAPRRGPAMRGTRGSGHLVPGRAGDSDSDEDRWLAPYLELRLDEEVDLERSTLALHGGDFLAARLAFNNAFSAAYARRDRRLVHPEPTELSGRSFAQGLACRGCGAALWAPAALAAAAERPPRVREAPSSPWAELLEHVLCVPPEDYLREEGQPVSRAFTGEAALRTERGALLLDEAWIEVAGADLRARALRLCEELKGSAPGADDVVLEPQRAMRHVQCAACARYLGLVEDADEEPTVAGWVPKLKPEDAREVHAHGHAQEVGHDCGACVATAAARAAGDGHGAVPGARPRRAAEHSAATLAELVEVEQDGPGESRLLARKARLYKHSLVAPAAPAMFAHYDASGTMFGSQLQRLADVRECRSVQVWAEYSGERRGLSINLWTADSWLQTERDERSQPVLKVTYKAATREGLARGDGLRATCDQLDRLRDDLERSTLWLPPSARGYQDRCIGFLKW